MMAPVSNRTRPSGSAKSPAEEMCDTPSTATAPARRRSLENETLTQLLIIDETTRLRTAGGLVDRTDFGAIFVGMISEFCTTSDAIFLRGIWHVLAS